MSVTGVNVSSCAVVPNGAFNLFEMSSFSVINNLTITGVAPNYWAIHARNTNDIGINNMILLSCPQNILLDNPTALNSSNYLNNIKITGSNITTGIRVDDGGSGSGTLVQALITNLNFAGNGSLTSPGSGHADNLMIVSGPNAVLDLNNSTAFGDGNGNFVNVLNGRSCKYTVCESGRLEFCSDHW